ncbi:MULTISPECIES: alpha-keto acid decarboxylase family protein [unclassified Mycolicibacterium]|uniref:alpha-keto acid decarboxylase family protein n=1 Tax=unclassified Mycolicibacterium TaxID=2636767 RepID=UPI0012DD0D1B|nr:MULTISPECIES: alpha-keto acid decarboxylase family protein [unclassified Mycolicibacterium]MUL83801.1 alpha-keto acid decarboxylase family protein [Mycolicibacterium sp. CBMA 329]MUL90133.1 alpha-keto acid decarboxylase family protein [Mycolicibacterium sp. CBMA 331]MUL97848.1 alpha-keto acid decarboxylase family protein [Mycolicibacterium sp. CBMA 334]MUM27002.1 alpha-keto acid decarboxylase family protein [Mycolicibacterium sp. CBMA 295]MUM39648.1 alpha-keto acid decarboxylase family prot
MSENGYTVGDYLLDRLAELGVTEVFGVPGDYQLEFLDHILAHPQINWIGGANELNAGYAADGYGRLRGMAALVTTFGVGELSAANAVAGSYAEHVPVVHIVGAPSKDSQASRRIVHHTLGDGDFEHFLRMSREITCAQANLAPATATREIDRVLSEVREQKRPGYLLIATDVARFPTEPPAAPLTRYTGGTSPRALSMFTAAAAELIGDHRLTVLADFLVHRLDCVDELNALLAADTVPHATLMWGKSLVDESSPNYLGIYAGAASEDSVREAIEDAPVLVTAGVLFTDMVSGFFSQRIDPARTIDIGVNQSVVSGHIYAPLDMSAALDAVTAILSERGITSPALPPLPVRPPTAPPDREAVLTQEVLWDRLSQALTPGNVVLADQGTSFYGMAGHRLASGVTFIGQPLWGSIGYTLPAALGAGLADRDRRTVLLIGDGAAQLTIQELGAFGREGLAPVVVVVNNDGYTVERAIHGVTAEYNDITGWRWTELPAALGVPDARTFRVSTYGELDDALTAAAATPERMVFLEVMLGRMDIPPLLTELAQSASDANAG